MYFTKKLIYLIVPLALLFLIEVLFLHPHIVLIWDTIPGFDAMFGFIATVVMAVIAKIIMNKVVERKADYYDRAFMPYGYDWFEDAIKKHLSMKEILILEKKKDWGNSPKEMADLPGYREGRKEEGEEK